MAFQVEEVANTHLDLLKIPLLEDVSEILAEQHATETIFLVEHIDPQTAMGFSKMLEGGC